MIGSTLSHFRITAKLGEGGMGEVYLATDSKLGRKVALKVLSGEMASDPERLERFKREAMALAALDHPAIVTIYSVEESEGVHFLTMQLVEGQTLDELIPEGGLPVERIVEIAGELSEALEAAHEKGIVHRDLKPSNVMVTRSGRVKVLDFGLAKIGAPQSDKPLDTAMATELHTRAGIVMGTVPYMSPEQVAGRPVDHRTDIFSLGVLLYEMATGQLPFHSDSTAELMSAILRDTPTVVTSLRTDLPDHLQAVIEGCLCKDPADRLPSAREVRDGLRDGNIVVPSIQAPVSQASRLAPAVDSGAARAGEEFWIAVLPFKYKGADADVAALADGMTEEIVTGLSRFSYLRVIAQGSALGAVEGGMRHRGGANAMDARYSMEGSLRQAGTKLRLAVQLVDNTTGAHLWAENYERTFSSDAVFELQDDLVPRIVSTVADMNGVLPRSMGEVVRNRDSNELSPYEAVLRSFAYFERVTADELAAARSALEVAVQKAPSYSDGWAMLALLCAQEYGQGFDLLPDSLASGAVAARRAVEAGPSNHLAHFSLAQVHFFQKEFPAFRNAAERAATLNPMDGNSIAFLGELLTYSGDFDRGLSLANRAKQLNPNHPGWYWYTDFFYSYRQRDYPAALAAVQKANLPGHWGMHCALAVVYGQVGDRDAADKALRNLLDLRPEFADIARHEFSKWWDPEFVDHMIDGLRKAGLELPSEAKSSLPSSGATTAASPGSGATRADEGFWVAVLPFKYTGASSEGTALADGLSEEIVSGLSRFSYLRVIARSSTERYLGAGDDVRSVGKELGARYVMEGSLRQAGSVLRVAVQLIDARTGAHLWTETYTRTLRLDDPFELQDELVPRIVSTVADWYGALPHSMSEAVRFKPPDELTSYEAVLRSFGYFERITPEEHAAVRAGLERAVEQAPGNADGWAMLSMMYGEEHRFGFNVQPEPLERSLQAARKAVDTAHANHFAWLSLAQAHFFRKEFDAFRNAADRAITLNPLDGSTLEYLSHLLAFSGDWERGCDLADRARQLNPNHPGWYWVLPALNAYRQGDYESARSCLAKCLLRGGGAQLFTHALNAAIHGQLGDRTAAEQILGDVLSQEPDFAAIAPEQFGNWYLPELVEQLMDGLQKAGLDLPPTKGAS